MGCGRSSSLLANCSALYASIVTTSREWRLFLIRVVMIKYLALNVCKTIVRVTTLPCKQRGIHMLVGRSHLPRAPRLCHCWKVRISCGSTKNLRGPKTLACQLNPVPPGWRICSDEHKRPLLAESRRN